LSIAIIGDLGYRGLPLINTEAIMSRRKKDPLRPLTEPERQELARISRSQAAPAVQVARATMILAVSRGDDYQQAALAAGRRSGDAVSHLVARFNAEGLAALSPRHGGGQPRTYDHVSRERILREVRREPAPEADGTATWSLSMLKGSLRSAPDGLPGIATSTIWQVLHEAGLSYQQSRTWCPTGSALRKRVSGTVVVTDPDSESKKS
jgi:transposase